MRNSMAMAMSCVVLSGCQTWTIMTSSKLEPASGDQERVVLFPVEQSLFDVREGRSTPEWRQLFGSQDEEVWKGLCLPITKAGVAAVAASALIAAGNAAWDLGVSAVNSKIDEFQQRSFKSWSASWSGPPATWDNLRCVVLARVSGGAEPQTQMAILLTTMKFQTGDKDVAAFQFAPALVSSRTSRALTENEGQGKGRIGLSVAAAVTGYKAGVEQKDTSDAVSIGGVAVSAPAGDAPLHYKPVAKDYFNYTKPVKYPAGSSMYINFSVVETGMLAGLDSQSKAEIKAMTDALGPVAKDAWKKLFEKLSKQEK